MAVPTEPMPIGRDEELAALDELVARLHGGPRATLIHGEAGIGKTALWRAGVDRARNSGVRVLATRAAEAEMPLALGGISDLLEGVFPEIRDELPDPQERALATALGLETPAEAPIEPIALPRA